MRIFTFGKNGLATALSVQLLLAPMAATMAQAEMLGTEAAISKYTALGNRVALLEALDRDVVQAELIALGIAPAEAEARLNALSDAEIASILTQMEQDNAGADIIGTLFSVFVILLVTDLLCWTNLFSFTRCVR